MVAKVGKAKNQRSSSRKTSRASKLHTKGSRRAPVRAHTPKHRSIQETGSIGEAATKVVRSGARLVGHAGKRVIARGARMAKQKLEGALRSAAGVTSSVLHSAASRVNKLTAK
jgi:hypothetical protein